MSDEFVCVGQPVVYYLNGDLKKPVAALVTSVDMDGRSLSLATFPLNAQTAVPRRGVRHISDPHFEDNPRHKFNFGAWDYVEMERNRLRDRAEEKARRLKRLREASERSKKNLEKVQKITTDDEIKEQVVRLFEKDKTPAQIAKAIGRLDWTEDRVVELLINLKLLEVPA